MCLLDHLSKGNYHVAFTNSLLPARIIWCYCLQLCWWDDATTQSTNEDYEAYYIQNNNFKFKIYIISSQVWIKCPFSGVFIAEIAHPSVRHIIGPFQIICCNFGVLFFYAMTAFLPWRMCKLIGGLGLALPAAFAILLCKETPHWLVKKGRIDEAR